MVVFPSFGAGKCQICGHSLLPIQDADGNKGVRCTNKTCPFNFLDLTCPTCGGAVEFATHPYLGRYVAKCNQGHEWNVDS